MLSERNFALLLTIAAIALRVYYAQLLFLNPDEAMQATASTAGQFGAFHHPPILFWLVWLFSFVSEQPWWLRLPSVLAGGVLPALIAVWLRRHSNAVTAWGLAVLIAVLPNIVLLTVQLRGYAVALAALVAAFIALDRAFDTLSRRWLVWHFAFLYIAILSEFMIVWAVIAVGCYALVHPSIRPLFRIWIAGQSGALALYAVLYVTVVAPIASGHNNEGLIQTYLAGAFPAAGQNLAVFVATGIFKQFVYLAGGIPAGVIAFVLADVCIGVWLWRRDPRAVLCLLPFVAIAAAVLRVYPFGRSRHTVVISVICLVAIGASIDWLGRRYPFLRWGVPAVLLALGLAFPMADIHNIPTEEWEAVRWARVEAALREKVPDKSQLFVDIDSYRILEFHYVARGRRLYKRNAEDPFLIGQVTVRYPGRTAVPGSGNWVLDSSIWTNRLKLPDTAVVEFHDPGVAALYRIP